MTIWKKWILTLTLHHTQKINPWWIIDIHVKSTIVNHLRENTEEDLCDIKVGKYFLNWSQKSLKLKKKKTDKMEL